MIPSDVPPQPWHTVGTDLFNFNGKDYLLLCDYFSKFPFVCRLRQNCSSEAVIDQMKQIFSEQGIPLIVRSDNGPHYTSHAFRNFTQTHAFSHITSSPHYSQSNGFIEEQIKTVKRTLDPYLECYAYVLVQLTTSCHLLQSYFHSVPFETTCRR